MISTYKLFEPVEESILGTTALIGGAAALLYWMFSSYSDSAKELDMLENDLISVYSDDYLTLGLTLKKDYEPSFMDNFNISGRFKQRMLSSKGISLIVNKKAAVLFKQKFGSAPMFSIIGTNKTYKTSYDRFLKDHSRFFTEFNQKIDQLANFDFPKAVIVNLRWMSYVLNALTNAQFDKNVGSSIDKVHIQGKQFTTIQFEP